MQINASFTTLITRNSGRKCQARACLQSFFLPIAIDIDHFAWRNLAGADA